MSAPTSSALPSDLGFSQPAEWAPHASVWFAWPSHEELWEEARPSVRAEVAAMAEAIRDVGPDGEARGEKLDVLVRTDEDEASARAAIGHLSPTFHRALYGDIWLRDTLPIFLLDDAGKLGSVRFTFNGWGGKYELPGDAELAAAVQAMVQQTKPKARALSMPLVLEGGSVDVDGEGTLLTTRQCLLNENRNPGKSQAELERALRDGFGVREVLWLDEGLLNDHTDGHVDTIARFVAPGVVVCMAPSGQDDPNRSALERIYADLRAMKDAKGRKLEVVRVPSPGKLVDGDGRVMPASYVNFYIGNSVVVVPTYGAEYDEAAVAALAQLFPMHEVVGRSARDILEGGGAFHCITQQQPL